MSQFLLYALTGVGLVCIGLYHVVSRESLLRRILALNVTGSGIFLLLVAVARRNGGAVPDPVPHAIVLTGIVVSVSITGLALAIIRRIEDEPGGAADGETIE